MLTFTFLGTGGAFTRRMFQSNVLVEAWREGPEKQDTPDETMLIDFGTFGPLALYQLGQKPGFAYLQRGGQNYYPSIRRIFITHLHADHVGGLEELALMNLFVHNDPSNDRPFKPQIISNINILLDLWDMCLKGGLRGIPGRFAMLQDYFFTLALHFGETGRDRFQMLKRYEFVIFQTDHVQIQRKYDWPSFGLLVTDLGDGESAFFSGDTKFDYPAYASMLGRAKTIFHDVQLHDQIDPVHAMLGELRTMPAAVKKKTLLYHYGDDWDQGPFDFVNDEFAGFTRQHHRYVIFK